MPIKNIQADTFLHTLLFWIPIHFVKCMTQEEERRDRQKGRPNNYIDKENFLVLNREGKVKVIKLKTCFIL